MNTSKFYNSEKFYDFQDVLIVPQASELNSRKDVNLEKKFVFKNGVEWQGIPIIAANMTTTGTFGVYDIFSKYKIITALHKFYTLVDFQNSLNNLNSDFFMVSTGISDDNYNNLVNIVDNIECKFICIDIANGYIQNFKKFCKKVRTKYPNKIIIAGNVVTKEAVDYLSDIGIDLIKIGIGPGSACTTRIQTGVGMPQLSCIFECYESAHKNGSYIISDGGITCPGDCAKAFVAGADFVMIGGEFSGHDENPGSIIEENGNKFKLFYGMSSTYAMQQNYNEEKNYRSSEGRVLKIKYKGPLIKTVENYLGGLRSTCTYTNSKSIKDLYTNGKFILVNNQYNNHLLK